jgi:hypothetical protein
MKRLFSFEQRDMNWLNIQKKLFPIEKIDESWLHNIVNDKKNLS